MGVRVNGCSSSRVVVVVVVVVCRKGGVQRAWVFCVHAVRTATMLHAARCTAKVRLWLELGLELPVCEGSTPLAAVPALACWAGLGRARARQDLTLGGRVGSVWAPGCTAHRTCCQKWSSK